MDNFLTNSFPENIRKEIEAIQKLILPLAQKTSKYMFWTFPLIAISVLNLFYLLFVAQGGNEIYVPLFIYAVIGALGLALRKETKLNKKEIERIGMMYITERIKKSNILTEDRKSHYIHAVKKYPIAAMEQFVKFLQEEERMGRWSKNEEEV